MGSAISYARRYGLQSMVLLPAEDDDGNVASTPKKEAKKVEKDPTDEWPDADVAENVTTLHTCKIHNKPMKNRGGETWDHRMKGELLGEQFDPKAEVKSSEAGLWYRCSGKGWSVGSLQR